MNKKVKIPLIFIVMEVLIYRLSDLTREMRGMGRKRSLTLLPFLLCAVMATCPVYARGRPPSITYQATFTDAMLIRSDGGGPYTDGNDLIVKIDTRFRDSTVPVDFRLVTVSGTRHVFIDFKKAVWQDLNREKTISSLVPSDNYRVDLKEWVWATTKPNKQIMMLDMLLDKVYLATTYIGINDETGAHMYSLYNPGNVAYDQTSATIIRKGPNSWVIHADAWFEFFSYSTLAYEGYVRLTFEITING